MSAPCVLVASCSENYSPNALVTQILKQDELPEDAVIVEDIRSYPWHIDTKYYTADVLLCTTESRTIGDEDFATRVEAIVIYFNGNKASFNQVKSWVPFVNEIDPEIRLLVCDQSLASDDIPRHMVHEWCLDYMFELIELTPDENEANDQTEDDFADSFGICRIHQALYAHTWPNLEMKDEPDIRSPYFQQLMREQAEENAKEIKERLSGQDASEEHAGTASETTPSCTPCQNNGQGDHAEGTTTDDRTAIPTDDKDSKEDKKKPKEKHKNDILDSMLAPEDAAMFEALGQDDPDGESFEKLFAQLKVMKDKSEALPPEQRKSYAENMAISFWRAIGGEEDEIANLSD